MNEMANLFKPIHELLSPTQAFSVAEKSTLSDSLYYMIVRLNKKKKHDKGNFRGLLEYYEK